MSICIFFCANTSFAQLNDSILKTHQTGIYQYGEHTGYSNYRVKRTKRKQIEYPLDKSQKMVFKVTWISPSEYWLELVKLKNHPKGCLEIGDIIKVTITDCSEEGYSCKSSSTNCPGTVRTAFVKIE